MSQNKIISMLKDIIIKKYPVISKPSMEIKEDMEIPEFEIFRRKFNLKYQKIRMELKREIDHIINELRDNEIKTLSLNFDELMKKRK